MKLASLHLGLPIEHSHRGHKVNRLRIIEPKAMFGGELSYSDDYFLCVVAVIA